MVHAEELRMIFRTELTVSMPLECSMDDTVIDQATELGSEPKIYTDPEAPSKGDVI